MKNYFKKFSIMFVMALAIVGFGLIQNGSVANAAIVGQQLMQPEDGWMRYDDSDFNIQYRNEFMVAGASNLNFNGMAHLALPTRSGNQYIKFAFYGTKLRLFDYKYYNASLNSKISFDGGITFEKCSAYGVSSEIYTMFYEKIGLENKVHNVIIEIPEEENRTFGLDFLDIDGYLVPSISLDKLSVDLTVGDSQQLNAMASGGYTEADVIWTSSTVSVATVDENGNVTANGAGQAVITAKIANTEIQAICNITVTATDGGSTDPTGAGDGNLLIELVDGNIKSYDVSDDEITNFINWYKNRDLDDSQPPYYKFTKGTYTDYVIHDKIDWFEVR